MTPTANGWTESDYFRASRAARRAFEARDDQLVFALDDEPLTARPVGARQEAVVRTGFIVERVASPHDLSPGGALDSTSTEAAANHCQASSGRLQEGL